MSEPIKKRLRPQIRILFVCTGNTCRSAMAESIIKSEIKKRNLADTFATSSAGLYVKQGEKMNDLAKKALKERGITPHRHSARVLTQTLLKRASIVICMTQQQKSVVKNRKAVTVGEITGLGDVPDPFGLTEKEYGAVADYLLKSADAFFVAAQKFYEKSKLPR